MSICANKKMAPGWTKLEDFNKPNVILTVRTGATPVAAAKKFMPKAQVRQFDDEAQAYQEVVNGRAHACVSSQPGPENWVNDHPDVLYLPLGGKTFTKEPICFAVRKGDPDAHVLLQQLDHPHGVGRLAGGEAPVLVHRQRVEEAHSVTRHSAPPVPARGGRFFGRAQG